MLGPLSFDHVVLVVHSAMMISEVADEVCDLSGPMTLIGRTFEPVHFVCEVTARTLVVGVLAFRVDVIRFASPG